MMGYKIHESSHHRLVAQKQLLKASAPVKRAKGWRCPGAAGDVRVPTGAPLNPSSEPTRVALCKAGQWKLRAAQTPFTVAVRRSQVLKKLK